MARPNECTQPFVSVHWNMFIGAWIVMQALDEPGPLRWEPVFDRPDHDVATAVAVRLRRYYAGTIESPPQGVTLRERYHAEAAKAK